MEQSLRKYLLSLNCEIINPIKKSLTNNEVVGWYCKSSSRLRKEHHLREIKKFIKENNIDYYVTDGADNLAEFFIYINQK